MIAFQGFTAKLAILEKSCTEIDQLLSFPDFGIDGDFLLTIETFKKKLVKMKCQTFLIFQRRKK